MLWGLKLWNFLKIEPFSTRKSKINPSAYYLYQISVALDVSLAELMDIE